jgi:glycogen(starch) synthase
LQIGAGWFPQKGGGLERYYYDLLHALPRNGVECVGAVVASKPIIPGSQGAVHAFGALEESVLKRAGRIRKLVGAIVSKGSVDLVASHFALYAAPVTGLLGDCPLVCHFHGPWAAEGRAEGASWGTTFFRKHVERRAYRRADRFIVLSHAFGDLLSREYRIDRRLVDVVPGGLETSRFAVEATRKESRERLGWPTDRPIVLAVRRLVQRMGLANLITAVQQLKGKHRDLLIIIAGTGILRQSLERQITAADLGRHVQLAGFVPDADLPYAYRAADMTVVPSIALEGFGLIAAESLAAGTPALVAPVGGLPEVVSGLSKQLIMSGTDPQAIIDAIDGALSGTLVLPDSAACQRHARESFDWSIAGAAIGHIYQRALH